MPKYISLMSDFGFKHVFANPDYPHILISFIESVIPTLSISSIEHIDTTQFAQHPDDRISIFDVFCRLDDGTLIIVEMQQLRQAHYVDRTILYGSHVIQRQAPKGEWNYELPSIYIISLMDFRLTPDDQSLVHTVRLQSDQQPEQVFYDKLHFIYIQLPNITDLLSDSPSLETWLSLIRNLHHREEPMTIDGDSKLTRAMIDAMTLAEFEKLTPDQKVLIDISQYAETEAYSRLWTAHNDGKQEGIEQGREEGREEIALSLLQKGMALDFIEETTGVTRQRLLELQQQADS